jgi:hypothetical protein
MRHVNGRLRRLCLAFSKKMENHRAAVALAYTHYNFCHVVKTLRVTPAMQAGVTDHVWSVEELLDDLMSDAPSEEPTARPLAHVKPEGAALELPAGRGSCAWCQAARARRRRSRGRRPLRRCPRSSLYRHQSSPPLQLRHRFRCLCQLLRSSSTC